MGKSRKHKHSPSQAVQPTGLPSVQETIKESEEAGETESKGGVPSSIHNCLSQLQSTEPLEKECGLMTLSQLFNQPEAAPIFVEMRIVRHIAPLMLDADENVRVAAVGALRNMSSDAAESEMIEQIVADDVFTPIAALLKKFYPSNWKAGSSTTSPSASSTSNRGTKEMDIFVNAVYLVRHLCEQSSTSISAFNREDLLPSLLSALDIDAFNRNVVLAVCQCLLTVTEDNLPSIQSLKQNEAALQHLQHLMQLHKTDAKEEDHADNAEAKVLLISILAAGILCNISSSAPPPSVLTTVRVILAVDLQKTVADLKVKIQTRPESETDEEMQEEEEEDEVQDGDATDAAIENNDASVAKGEKSLCNSAADVIPNVVSQRNQDLEKELEQIWDLMSAQQMALELLVNICSAAEESDNDEEEWNVDDDGESSTSSADQPDAETLEGDTGEGPPQPHKIGDALVWTDIVQLISHQFCSGIMSGIKSDLEAMNDVVQADNLIKKLMLVQCRALDALQNLVMWADAKDLDGASLLPLFRSLTSNLNVISSESEGIILASTSLLRAVSDRLSTSAPDAPLASLAPLAQSQDLLADVHQLQRLYAQTPASEVRTNIVRTSANLAAIALRETPAPDILRTVGAFLLDVADRDADVAVAAESLDAIFDAFAEDDVDAVAREIQLVVRLQALVDGFKDKLRCQRPSLGDRKAVVQTVSTNLKRFIKYKSTGKN